MLQLRLQGLCLCYSLVSYKTLAGVSRRFVSSAR